MKISNIKISATHMSRAVLVAASLSCAGVSGHVFAAETMDVASLINIFKGIQAEQVANDEALASHPIELTRFEGDSIREASTFNLGHLQKALRTRLASQLPLINDLQKAALAKDETFVAQVAAEIVGAANYVYGLADAGTLDKNKLEAAQQLWLLKALADYGIISESYLQLHSAKTAEHEDLISAKDRELKAELDSSIEEKNKGRDLKNSEFDATGLALKEKKGKLEAQQATETNTSRKSSLVQQVAEIDVQLAAHDKAKIEFNATIDQENAELTAQYDARIKELNDAKADDLAKLDGGYSYVFQELGSTGFKTFGRYWSGRPSDRAQFPEFKEFDKLLSTKYMDLHSKAKLSLYMAIFDKLGADAHSAAKMQLMKGLLGIAESDYKSVLVKQKQVEEARASELAKKESQAQTQISNAVSSITEEVAPVVTQEPPTVAEAMLTSQAALKFDPKKKVNDSDTEIEESGVEAQSSIVPLTPSSVPNLTNGGSRLESTGVISHQQSSNLRMGTLDATASPSVAASSSTLSFDPVVSSSGESQSSVVKPSPSSQQKSQASQVQKKNNRGGRGRHSRR